ncbi:hypothetical protein ACQ5SO_13480 [Rhodovulum sp. DZ06]|uniref:hypothetical protein n=1 Tax=Rhodovulum sp. DZ06 TaxID=3425126 RepID=UPI003D3472B6
MARLHAHLARRDKPLADAWRKAAEEIALAAPEDMPLSTLERRLAAFADLHEKVTRRDGP